MHMNENDVYVFEAMLSVILRKLASYLHRSSGWLLMAKFAPRERREKDINDCIRVIKLLALDGVLVRGTMLA